jgi:hypothetical protein
MKEMLTVGRRAPGAAAMSRTGIGSAVLDFRPSLGDSPAEVRTAP